MRRHIGIGAILITLLVGGRGPGAEPPCDAAQGGWLQRWHPVGGWDPYGGGLLHWWNPNCFPRCGAADDYCRKPLPKVCWPSYPSYYSWGPPQSCSPRNNACWNCNKPQ